MIDVESKPEKQIVLVENSKAREKKYWEFIKMKLPITPADISEVGLSRTVLVCVVTSVMGSKLRDSSSRQPLHEHKSM